MTTPVTATVAEPVRAKRPTGYAILRPRDTTLLARGETVVLYVCPTIEGRGPAVLGDTEVVIPGECDDAPSGWRPASEPPDSSRWVLAHEKKCGWLVGMYSRNGEWTAIYATGHAKAINAITHWTELPANPTPPGAKK